MSSSTIPTIPRQNHEEYLNNSKVLLAAVISLSAVVTLVLLLHAYARWFLHRRATIIADATGDPLHRHSLTARVSYASDTQPLENGLDRKVITKLPLFTVEQDGAGLECVVCLSVMEAGENGRILPGCKHRFHIKCIDTWLMCHSTCPVCRTIVKAELASGMPVSVSLAVEDTAAQEIVVVSPAVTQTEISVDVSATLPITSSSLGCSHKRMLRKSRSEGRVFPSVVNWSRSLSP